jgi:cytochrome d ubiquinol oxidase subunit I
MTDLFAARSQMAMSLGSRIIFVAVGVALPLLMAIAEELWLRTQDETYRTLAEQLAKGAAILFAVGTVSGTVLSFELGLLWPRFMEFAGTMIGLPFTLDGFAFFVEAIFLRINLYGWQRVPPVRSMAPLTTCFASAGISRPLAIIAPAVQAFATRSEVTSLQEAA